MISSLFAFRKASTWIVCAIFIFAWTKEKTLQINIQIWSLPKTIVRERLHATHPCLCTFYDTNNKRPPPFSHLHSSVPSFCGRVKSQLLTCLKCCFAHSTIQALFQILAPCILCIRMCSCRSSSFNKKHPCLPCGQIPASYITCIK